MRHFFCPSRWRRVAEWLLDAITLLDTISEAGEGASVSVVTCADCATHALFCRHCNSGRGMQWPMLERILSGRGEGECGSGGGGG